MDFTDDFDFDSEDFFYAGCLVGFLEEVEQEDEKKKRKMEMEEDQWEDEKDPSP